jgi:hypothetical protein
MNKFVVQIRWNGYDLGVAGGASPARAATWGPDGGSPAEGGVEDIDYVWLIEEGRTDGRWWCIRLPLPEDAIMALCDDSDFLDEIEGQLIQEERDARESAAEERWERDREDKWERAHAKN